MSFRSASHMINWVATSKHVSLDMCAQRRFRSACLAKIQISLRIRAVWSESSLGTFWRASDAKFFHADNTTLIRQRENAGWFESSLGAHVRRYVVLRYCSVVIQWNLWKKATFETDFRGWCGKVAVLERYMSCNFAGKITWHVLL